MPHPFENKLFAFIGTPERCTTREARDALSAVGGVTDDKITTFIEYVVEFKHNGKSKKYLSAKKNEEKGLLIIINESYFFDILEGKSKPPINLVREKGIESISALPDEIIKIHEKARNDILNYKRMNNMAKYGVKNPDGSITKIDFRPFELIRRIIETIKTEPENYSYAVLNTTKNKCDICNKPARIRVNDRGSEYGMLCLECHNMLVCAFNDIPMPDNVPETLTFTSIYDRTHTFEISLMMFADSKTLTAIERGEQHRKYEIFGDLDADFDGMLQMLKRKIQCEISTLYMDDDGTNVDGEIFGHIEYNKETNSHDIYIDGKPYTWSELEKNISNHEGWNIRIEFGDFEGYYDDKDDGEY